MTQSNGKPDGLKDRIEGREEDASGTTGASATSSASVTAGVYNGLAIRIDGHWYNFDTKCLPREAGSHNHVFTSAQLPGYYAKMPVSPEFDSKLTIPSEIAFYEQLRQEDQQLKNEGKEGDLADLYVGGYVPVGGKCTPTQTLEVRGNAGLPVIVTRDSTITTQGSRLGRILADKYIMRDNTSSVNTSDVESVILQEISDALRTYKLFIQEMIKFHHRGYLVGDIAPSNSMPFDNEQRIRLMDFELARKIGRPLEEIFDESIPKKLGGGYERGYDATTKSNGEALGPVMNKRYGMPSLTLKTAAQPYQDIYSVTTIFCEMITKKVMRKWMEEMYDDRWMEELKGDREKVNEGLLKALKSDGSAPYRTLADLLMKGTDTDPAKNFKDGDEVLQYLKDHDADFAVFKKQVIRYKGLDPTTVPPEKFFISKPSLENIVQQVKDTKLALLPLEEKPFVPPKITIEPLDYQLPFKVVDKRKKEEKKVGTLTPPNEGQVATLPPRPEPGSGTPSARATPEIEATLIVDTDHSLDDVVTIGDKEVISDSSLGGIDGHMPPAKPDEPSASVKPEEEKPSGAELPSRSRYRTLAAAAATATLIGYTALRIIFNHPPEINVISTTPPVGAVESYRPRAMELKQLLSNIPLFSITSFDCKARGRESRCSAELGYGSTASDSTAYVSKAVLSCQAYAAGLLPRVIAINTLDNFTVPINWKSQKESITLECNDGTQLVKAETRYVFSPRALPKKRKVVRLDGFTIQGIREEETPKAQTISDDPLAGGEQLDSFHPKAETPTPEPSKNDVKKDIIKDEF